MRLGALLTSLTVTVNEFVLLNGGEPLSVTTTVIVLTLGPWASVGVQFIAPVLGFMDRPAGGKTRLKVNVLAGISASVAEAETDSVANSFIVWFAGTVSEGGLFTSLTVTLNVLVALRGGEPSSVTTVIIV